MKLHLHFLSLASGLLLLSSCIDNNYDLSDIDTTSEFKVKDLVLPLNLDPIFLKDVIKVKEGDNLKDTTINGQSFYAVVHSGSFSSDPIHVNSFDADAKPMTEKSATFRVSSRMANKHRAASDAIKSFLLIQSVEEDLEYTSSSSVDGSIKDITQLYFDDDIVFNIGLSSGALADISESYLQNVTIFLPKGLSVVSVDAGGIEVAPSAYSPATGALKLDKVPFSVSNGVSSASISVFANALSLADYDNAFTYDQVSESGSFDLKSKFVIDYAELVLSGSPESLAQNDELTYTVNFGLSQDIHPSAFMGVIQYDLSGSGLNIEPVNLENLPDFLDDPNTNLILANPQLYLGLNNPVGVYGLGYQSGFNILVSRTGSQSVDFPGPLVQVEGVQQERFNFLLAPQEMAVSNIPEEFQADLQRKCYPNLGHILSGEGIPQMLDVELIDPMIEQQETSSPFRLDSNIPAMEGEYLFLAPLALEDGSEIIKKIDGWWSEDLDALTINVLKISALADSDLDMGVKITIYPIDKFGNKIESASVSTVSLPANSSNLPIEFVMEGVITDLDGIAIYVMAAGDDQKPLAPDQYIKLEDIKAKVTGNYTKKL